MIDKILAGNMAAVARLITKVERRDPEAFELIKKLYRDCGNAHIVGVTGPPGVGKSCLVAALVNVYRKTEKTVGVLAVDPTSPLTGGAFLGDRDRMINVCRDRGVFIRSLASRGALGGLAEAVNVAADILDAAGKDIIIIETVGVGQSEIEITELAHTVVLTLMPGYGDTLQVLKAGIMEVSDVLVVNKSDKPGADKTKAELEGYFTLEKNDLEKDHWRVPVLKTCALKEEGVSKLADEILNHHKFISSGEDLFKKDENRRLKQFLNILRQRIEEEFMATLKTDAALQKWVEGISKRRLDPYSASEEVITMIKESRNRLKEKQGVER